MLGWTLAVPACRRQWRRVPKDEPVDYALFLEDTTKPSLLVEAKRVGDSLSEAALKQLLKYAVNAGIKWVLLTNGRVWRIYNALAEEATERKLLAEMDIADPSISLEDLLLVSKQSMREGRADAAWRRKRKLGVVRDAVNRLFASPKRLLSALTGLLPQDFAEGELKEALAPLSVLEVNLGGKAPPPPPPPPGGADTLVVPARKDGFNRVFLGENRWYAIKLSERKVKERAIRYIAVYQVKPVSAITHCAEVASMERWQDSDKWVVNFKGPAVPLEPIRYDPRGKKKPPQSPQYTDFERLRKAKTLDDVF